MAFPAEPLDLRAELEMGAWTDVSSSVYQRAGTSPPVAITRGRPDEASQPTASQAAFQLNNRNGDFSPENATGAYFGLLGRNTPLRFSIPAQANYLRIEADSLSSASCPDSAALHIAGDIDVRVDVRLSGQALNPGGLPNAILAARYGGDSTGNNAWFFQLSGTGLEFGWTPDGGTTWHTAASTIQPPYRGRNCLRAAMSAATGTVTFYTGPAGGADGSTWTQLGDAVDTGSGATSIYAATCALQAGYYPFAAGSTGSANGAWHELEVRDGIGGTVVAHPVFSAQAAGVTSFADAESNTWTLNGTAQISDRNYRYHGEMSSLPPKWDVTGSDIWVAAQAAGVLRRIGQGTAPVYSPLKRALLSQAGTLAPVAYWPCEDGQAATQLGSATGGPMMTVTGTLQAATDTTFLCSASLPKLNGSQWHGRVPAYTSHGSIIARFLMHLGTVPAGDRNLISLDATGTCQAIGMRVYDTSGLGLYGQNAAGTVFDTGGVSVTNMPAAVWVSLELRPGSGGTVDYALVTLVPGASAGQEFTGSFTGTIGAVTDVWVNPAAVFTDTVVGHISVQSDWESLFALYQPLNAWQGETAANRFARLAGENGYACRIRGAPDVSAAMGAQPVDTLSALLQQCETADRGQVYEPREVLGLGYRTLASMLSQSPAVTIDYALAQAGGASGGGADGGLDPTYDDQFTRNHLVVTRQAGATSGATWEYALDDGSAMSISPPPAGAGDYSTQVTLNVQADGQLPDEAGWMVHIGTVDEARWPAIPLNLARPAMASAYYGAADADIGDYAELTAMLAQITADPVRQLIWEVRESLGGFHHVLEWCGVPESPYEAAVFDDAVYGRADTDGSTLTSGVTATATTLSVATGAGYPVWTQDAADVPFDIAVAGERMTVTAVTGSSSPQSFTVTRSVNGVSKAQSAGADVRLWFPPVFSLI